MNATIIIFMLLIITIGQFVWMKFQNARLKNALGKYEDEQKKCLDLEGRLKKIQAKLDWKQNLKTQAVTTPHNELKSST